MTYRPCASLAILLASIAVEHPAVAQEIKFTAEVKFSIGFAEDLELEGDKAFFVAPNRTYYFSRIGGVWGQRTLLSPPTIDPYVVVEPTSQVALDGSVLVRGTGLLDESGSSGTWTGGAIVRYQNSEGTNAWGHVASIVGETIAGTTGQFGLNGLDVSGDYIVVGDPESNPGCVNCKSGAAFVFGRNTGGTDNWGLVKTLMSPDPDSLDHFGRDAAISGDWLVVGEPYDDKSGTCTAGDISCQTGTAYVFGRDHGGTDNWGLVAQLFASDPAPGDRFGHYVAISGDVILVSAYGKAGSSGAVYVFQRDAGGANNWGQVARLSKSTPVASDYFGIGVATNGSYAVVGAYGDNSFYGAAYLYHRDEGGTDNWGLRARIQSSAPEQYESYARKVAVSDDMVLVGAPYNTAGGTGGTKHGAAYGYGPLTMSGLVEASGSAAVSSDSTVDFGAATGVDVVFANVTSGGRVTVERFDSPPQNVSEIVALDEDGNTILSKGSAAAALSVYDDHWLIHTDSLFAFGSAAEVRFNASEIPTPGFSDPANVTVYKRPVYGTGSFSPVTTSYTNGEIVCTGVTGFSEFVMAAATPLPVELMQFRAIVRGQQVTLQWTTGSEINNAGFEVEHASEEGDFKLVGFVTGHGTTTERHEYRQTLGGFLPGNHRFRLKQIDVDGGVGYSPVVRVSIETPGPFVLESPYPNPFRSQTHIPFAVGREQELELVLYDLLGKRVRTLFNGRVQADRSHVVTLTGDGLPAGVYVIRLVGKWLESSREVILLK